MKGKMILKSLLGSYLLTGVFLVILAVMLFQFNLSEKSVFAGILAIYVLSCMLGGIIAGKIMRRRKYLWGMLTGISYFILLAAVSFLVEKRWDMSWGYTLLTIVLCVGGGAIGGMIS